MQLVQLEMGYRFLVSFRLRHREAIQHCRCDRIFHAIDVHMVQVLTRPDVTVRRVIRHLKHLLVELLRDDEPHGRRSASCDPAEV